MAQSAAAVVKELERLADPRVAAASQWFFKTAKGEYGYGDVFLGIRAGPLRDLAKAHYDTPLPEVLRLLRSKYHEARSAALLLLVRAYEKGDAATRERVFRAYLANTRYINNWDLVDLSAGRIVGVQLGRGRQPLLTRLARSSSLWERRIAIMATQTMIASGHYAETLRIAKLLLHDEHDLIHKAVGWMLREVGKKDRAVEESFLDRYAGVMPRTMLRYSLEKFPPALRTAYMKR